MMFQFVVNANLLRELDERKLINAYARLIYINEEDLTEDNIIRSNLQTILDWDKTGNNGLGIYCGKFESLKRKEFDNLVQFIKINSTEIKNIASQYNKKKRIELKKHIDNTLEAKERRNFERCTNENYQVSGRGKKAKPIFYNGTWYKSQQECIYKEGITKHQLYKYLKDEKNSIV